MTSRPERSGRAADPPASTGATARANARALVFTLGACLALRVLASGISSNWVWGLDTFRWWPLPLAAMLVALAAAGFVPPAARAIGAALEGIGATWQRHPARGDGLVVAAVAAIVLLSQDPLRFVGDLRLRVGALAVDTPIERLFPQAYPLDVLINLRLPRALAGADLDPATALQIVGALSALVFAIVGLAFLRAAGARGQALPASACVFLAGGYLVHFAGYDKYGPLLVGLALAATGVMRLDAEGRGAWMLAAGAAISMLASRIGYAILPPTLLALALAWRRGGARLAVGGATALTLIVALALLPRTVEIARHLDLSAHMPGGAVARALATPGEPEALVRIVDALNLLFLLVPLWPAGLVLLARRDRAHRRGRRKVAGAGAVAALALGLQLTLLLVFRARQGIARDWDAYAGVALVLALVLCAAFIAWWRDARDGSGAAAATTVSLATAIAFWGLHASEPMARRRIEAALAARPPWSETARVAAHDGLGLRALDLHRFDEAARRFEAAGAILPNPRFYYQAGLAHLRGGHLDAAWTAFAHAAGLDRYAADPWTGLAQVSLARRDTLQAAAFLDTALTRDPRDAVALQARRALAARPQGR